APPEPAAVEFMVRSENYRYKLPVRAFDTVRPFADAIEYLFVFVMRFTAGYNIFHRGQRLGVVPPKPPWRDRIQKMPCYCGDAAAVVRVDYVLSQVILCALHC